VNGKSIQVCGKGYLVVQIHLQVRVISTPICLDDECSLLLLELQFAIAFIHAHKLNVSSRVYVIVITFNIYNQG